MQIAGAKPSGDQGSIFWLKAAGVAILLVVFWLALNYFDKTLAKARTHLATNPEVAAKLGAVDGTTLYKLRYNDSKTDTSACFAEYFFFVSGTRGSLNVREKACGDEVSPLFAWVER